MPWSAEKKTPDEWHVSPTHSETLVECYERLRREVLAKEIGSALGLAVFLRQGMVGWMDLQSVVTATVPSPSPRRSEPAAPLAKDLAGELVPILTELILTRKELNS